MVKTVSIVLMLFNLSCGVRDVMPGIDAFGREIEAAAICVEGDPCVMTGSTKCTCSAPVNMKSIDEIVEKMNKIDCGNVNAGCSNYADPQPKCVDGTCAITNKR